MGSMPPSPEEVQMFLRGWMSSEMRLILVLFREDAKILGFLRATIASVSTDMLRIAIVGDAGWINLDLRELGTGFIMSDRLPAGEIFDMFKPSTEFFLVLRQDDLFLAFIEPREGEED
jgi:hypothetical protein